MKIYLYERIMEHSLFQIAHVFYSPYTTISNFLFYFYPKRKLWVFYGAVFSSIHNQCFEQMLYKICFNQNLKCALNFSVNVSPSTLVNAVSRLAMPAGSCTVWNTVSNLMVRCPVTRPSEVAMTPSTPSSARRGPGNTFQGLSLWTWNQPS